MKDDIAAHFGLQHDPTWLEKIGHYIGDVFDDLNTKKLWRFNLIEASPFNTSAGTSDYPMPSDLWKIYSVRKNDGIDYQISSVRQHDFDIMFQSQNNITGFPYVNVAFNIYREGTIKLFPTPEGAYEILARYFKLLTKPSGDDDFLDMPQPFATVPKYGAMARVADLVGEDNRYWEGKFQEAFAEMNTRDEDEPDEDLRFKNIEELDSRNMAFINPALRPRYLDFY